MNETDSDTLGRLMNRFFYTDPPRRVVEQDGGIKEIYDKPPANIMDIDIDPNCVFKGLEKLLTLDVSEEEGESYWWRA